MTQEIDINKIQERNDDVRKKFNNYELTHETAKPICEYMAEALEKCQKIVVDGDDDAVVVALVVPNTVASTASLLLKLFIKHYLDAEEEET